MVTTGRRIYAFDHPSERDFELMKVSAKSLKLGACLAFLAAPVAAQSPSRDDTIQYLIQQCVGVPVTTRHNLTGFSRNQTRIYNQLSEDFGSLQVNWGYDDRSFTQSIPLDEVGFSIVKKNTLYGTYGTHSEFNDVDVIRIICKNREMCIDQVVRMSDGEVRSYGRYFVSLPCRQPAKAINALQHLQSITSDPFG
jgi:hypothetical protein